MTLPTFKFFFDAEKTQPLPVANGMPVLRVRNNGLSDQVVVVYFGSNTAGRKFSVQEGSSDASIKISLVEKAQAWEASKAVMPGKIVRPSNGKMYKCTNGGVTSEAEPVWAANAGMIVIDGSARWVNLGTSYTLADVALALSESAAETATAKTVSLPAELFTNSPSIPVFLRIKNTDTALKTDATDCVLNFSFNDVIEEGV